MKRVALLGWVFVFFLAFNARAQLVRETNSTLRMPANPAQRGYTLQSAFGAAFSGPVAFATPPGETNRLFIVEKDNARILVLTNLAAANPSRLEFLNIRPQVTTGGEQGLLGLAFHPNFASNGHFYVFFTTSGTLSNRLSRFTVSETNANFAHTNTQVILINQRDEAGNHNGGDLHFGPDGYLYVALGDEGGGGDQYANSQRINKDFFAGILRIDVDKRSTNLPPNAHAASSTNYFVPADNPFVGATNFNGLPVNPATVRTEFWATGLRNPWRMSFDPLTGTLWCGDVGQSAREEIDIIVKGGNYGWNYREGIQAYTGTPPPGFTHIDPVWDYPRTDGFSVTGGRVYRGNRISQLYGMYVFADYGSGNFWAMQTNGPGRATPQRLSITGTGTVGNSAFGVDPSNGDLLVANVNDGGVRRLVYSAATTGVPLPATLADTGAFSDLTNLTVHPGIVPYEVNLPFWSDDADKRRWFSNPNTNHAMRFNATNNWQFPTGAVWVKHFEIQTNDNPVAKRRLETRFIVRNTNGVYGVTYRWDSETNAVLVPEDGTNETFTVTRNGGQRTQTWRYPSRSECLTCHNAAAGWVLGFNSQQLNRDITHGSLTTNQIKALASAGYLTNAPSNPHALLALADPRDLSVSQEFRVRSYLDANCAQCHRPGGLALGSFDARIHTPTDAANIILGPLVNSMEHTNNRTLVPAAPERSMIPRRMNIRGPGQMPPIASNLVDNDGVELMLAYISNDLPNRRTFARWQSEIFNDPLAPEAAPDADPDLDTASNLLEWLAVTDPKTPGDAWDLRALHTTNQIELTVTQPVNRGVLIEYADSINGPWFPVNHLANRLTFPSARSTNTITDARAAGEARFYRARIQAP